MTSKVEAGRGAPAVGIAGTLRRSLAAWRRHPQMTLLVVLVLVVQQLYHTFFAYNLKLIIDLVQKGGTLGRLAQILFTLAAGFAIFALTTMYGEKIIARAAGLIMGDFRRHLYDKLLGMSADSYSRTPLGDILARFTTDLETIQVGFTQATFYTMLLVLSLLINVPVMFTLEWRLTLLALILLPFIMLFNRRFIPQAGEATYTFKQTQGALANTVQETVRAQMVVKAFSLQGMLSKRFAVEVANLIEVTVRSRFSIAIVSKGSALLLTAIQIMVIMAGAALALRGELSAGSLVAFISIIGVVTGDTLNFSKTVVPALIDAGASLRRADGILQLPPTIVDAPGARPLPRLRGQIRFDEVDFGYTSEQLNLTRLSLAIHQGQSVAFVGPSGSGKSTVLGLLQRFYDPLRGHILLDGQDIAAMTQDSLHGQIGVVFQENFLFNTSVRENIRLARLDATDAEVEAAARAAEIHDVIMTLPQGYDTSVGEAGGRLSGGQKQRIAIARAILRDPAILVLDEATSALDPGTEAAINDTIARLAHGRTVIAVTHRLASVTGLDQIFVMQKGRLVEQGTHRSLLDQHGLYHELWQKQSGFEVSDDGRFAQVDAGRLKRMRLFEQVEIDKLSHFANQFRSEFFDAGQDVIVQGQAGDKLYLIVRGTVDVLARDGAGVEQQVDHLEDGDHFGEMALLLEQPRSATVRTATPSLLLSLSREQLMLMLERFPETRPAIEQRIAQSQSNLAALRGRAPASANAPAPAGAH